MCKRVTKRGMEQSFIFTIAPKETGNIYRRGTSMNTLPSSNGITKKKTKQKKSRTLSSNLELELVVGAEAIR